MKPHWVDSTETVVGSFTAETRLAQAIEAFARLGTPVPKHGRHLQALSLLRQINTSGAKAFAASPPEYLSRLAFAHRDARELFIIAYCAVHSRNLVRSAFTPKRLRAIGAGGPHGDGANPYPRNIQFELFMAAYLHLGGLIVSDGEPDLLLQYGAEDIGVACKRVRSLSPTQVAHNFSDGVGQIQRQKRRGLVALSLEPHFASLPVNWNERGGQEPLAACFDGAMRKAMKYQKVEGMLGYIAVGRTSGWLPDSRHDGKPGLYTNSPIRWFGWPDTEEDSQVYKSLVPSWNIRLDEELQRLSSTGPL